MAKDQKGVLNSVFCDAVCVNGNSRHLKKFPKEQIFQDKAGSSWCPEHRNRGALMNWAIEHDFPAITFTGAMRYAIGVDKYKGNISLWMAAVLTGSDDMIQAAIQSVMDDDDEVAS